MKYQVGDRVITNNGNVGVISELMLGDFPYYIEGASFSEDFLEHYFEQGDLVDVRDTNYEEWGDPRIFFSIAKGQKNKYVTVDNPESFKAGEACGYTGYEQCRPHREEEKEGIKIEITRNGEPFNEKLSVESARALGIIE